MNTENDTGKVLSAAEKESLLGTLKARFGKNGMRHEGLAWSEVETRLEASPEKLFSLKRMEETGGEPDVVGRDEVTGEIFFFDCAAESPEGRRNTCFDKAALDARKEFKPQASALGLAEEMGVEILSEQEYRFLQTLGAFDLKTSSWIKTPADIRKLGGALFADRRYGHVFVYHNGAQSYYGARGFRASLKV